MTRDFVWKMVPVGFFFFVILIWALIPTVWVSAFPPAEGVAKRDVNQLNQVLAVLEELGVTEYQNDLLEPEFKAEKCEVLKYERDIFANHTDCIYRPDLGFKYFDEQARADFEEIKSLLPENIWWIEQCELGDCLRFSRFSGNPMDWLRSFPDSYYYEPGYDLPKRELNNQYYPIDDNWYYVHFGG